MSRRVRLPGADELFRPTSSTERPAGTPSDEGLGVEASAVDAAVDESAEIVDGEADEEPVGTEPVSTEPAARRGSGRVKHDEKMTVYLTAEELLAVEQTRLALRRELGQAVDRGRLVREAIALALADYEGRGADSDLVGRLQRK